MTNLTLILSTAREGRNSEQVYNYLQTILSQRQDISLNLVDIRDYASSYTIPPWEKNNDQIKAWKSVVDSTDAFILVSPEYNHSYPGELKILLDKSNDYKYKLVMIAGVSAGKSGGGNMIEDLSPLLSKLNFQVLDSHLHFPYVETQEFIDSSTIQTYIDKLISHV